MFALVDCNSFYCSCEQAFQPRLDGRPVVVLSNNDGCIVARNQAAKDCGLKMGEPLFQVKHLVQQYQVQAFSANYALYGSISKKVMRYLQTMAPEIEIYSIDEAFLDLHGMERYFGSLTAYAQRIRRELLQRTHIPTCVGIGPTKTLAKAANRLAKKHPELNGVLHLDTKERQWWALEKLPVEDVWGIGHQYAQKLQAAGITTAAQLARCSEPWVRKHLGGVVGVRLLKELQGFSCQGLQPSEDGTLTRKSIAYTRTFGRPLSAFEDVLAAVAAFTSRAAVKLRRQRSDVQILTVFLSKNRFSPEPPPYTRSAQLTLPVPTSDTGALLGLARQMLQQLWQPGQVYRKAGVVLDGLEPQGAGAQLGLFAPPPAALLPTPQKAQLMQRLDALNARYGRGSVQFGTGFVSKQAPAAWESQVQNRTPAYTTRWDELWLIKI